MTGLKEDIWSRNKAKKPRACTHRNTAHRNDFHPMLQRILTIGGHVGAIKSRSKGHTSRARSSLNTGTFVPFSKPTSDTGDIRYVRGKPICSETQQQRYRSKYNTSAEGNKPEQQQRKLRDALRLGHEKEHTRLSSSYQCCHMRGSAALHCFWKGRELSLMGISLVVLTNC